MVAEPHPADPPVDPFTLSVSVYAPVAFPEYDVTSITYVPAAGSK
jgi:hypothetical protein